MYQLVDSKTALSIRIAGIVATVGFLCISAFQCALALGAPLGKAAWGGASAELSIGLRFVSAVATFFWIWAAAVVYQRSGYGSVMSIMSEELVEKAT